MLTRSSRAIPQPGGLLDSSRGLRSAERDDTPGGFPPANTTPAGSQNHLPFVRRDSGTPSGCGIYVGAVPGVSPRLTPGYFLPSLRLGAPLDA